MPKIIEYNYIYMWGSRELHAQYGTYSLIYSDSDTPGDGTKIQDLQHIIATGLLDAVLIPRDPATITESERVNVEQTFRENGTENFEWWW